MNKLGLIILLISTFSCSSIQFKTDNLKNQNVDITFDKNIKHKDEVRVKIEKKFFLWGSIPNHEVDVSKVLADKGYDSISSFVIKEEPTAQDMILTLITFGMYYPQTYYLSGNSSI